MLTRTIRVVAGVLLLVAACAQTSYQPVVDFASSRKPAADYDRDLGECQQLAAQRNPGSDAATGGALGAVGGGALGAALGAILGGGRGAAMGAAVGAVGGGAGGAAGAGTAGMKNQRTIIKNCLSARGYTVVGD